MLVPKAAAACAAGILFPFYIYPSHIVSCDQWTPLITALNAHPTLPFTIVVNPSSGPGGTLPDSEYQACLPTLRQTSNTHVKLIGYVRTNYTNRAAADVNADVATYANWPTSYRPDGIFFDEVTADATHASTYNTYITNVHTHTWNSGSGYTILNPGAPVTDAYFNQADLVVTIEKLYSNFANSQLTLNNANQPVSKQAVILTDSPSTLPTSTVTQLISQDHLNSIFLTDIQQASITTAYGAFPSYWTSFVSAIASASGC